jgi:GR25 family glycosyltransferase involved in LPS biosynthesis
MEGLPIFIISLKKDVGRRRRLTRRLLSLGLDKQHIYIVWATTPDTLPSEKVKDIDLTKKDQGGTSYGLLLSCFQSHLNTYEHIISMNVKSAVVMEDDMMFLPSFKKCLEQYNSKFLEQNLPLVLLKWSQSVYDKLLPCFRGQTILTKNTSNAWCTGCYWISNSHANALLQLYGTLDSYKEIENITAEALTRSPENYRIEPPIAIEDPNNKSNLRSDNIYNELSDMRWYIPRYTFFEDENWSILYAMRQTKQKNVFYKLKGILNMEILDEDMKELVTYLESFLQ